MSNSQFTEARRKKKKKGGSRVCNLQSKSAQQKYSSSEDSGMQSFLKKGKKKETRPILRPSSCIVCKPFESSLRPRLIILPQGAYFLRPVVLLSTFVTEEGTQRQENRFWPKSFCGKGSMRILSTAPGLLIRIPGVHRGRESLWSPQNSQMNRTTIPERECARTYFNYIIFTLNNHIGRTRDQKLN